MVAVTAVSGTNVLGLQASMGTFPEGDQFYDNVATACKILSPELHKLNGVTPLAMKQRHSGGKAYAVTQAVEPVQQFYMNLGNNSPDKSRGR